MDFDKERKLRVRESQRSFPYFCDVDGGTACSGRLSSIAAGQTQQARLRAWVHVEYMERGQPVEACIFS